MPQKSLKEKYSFSIKYEVILTTFEDEIISYSAQVNYGYRHFNRMCEVLKSHDFPRMRSTYIPKQNSHHNFSSNPCFFNSFPKCCFLDCFIVLPASLSIDQRKHDTNTLADITYSFSSPVGEKKTQKVTGNIH